MGNQVLVVDSEDALQISIHKLETLTSKYGLNISKSNIKSMALKGRDPVRSKTVINNNVIEEGNTSFIYLGCSTTYQNEKDITVKISQFMQITGIIKKNFKTKPSQVQKHTRLKIYNSLALPTVLYGREIWTIRE